MRTVKKALKGLPALFIGLLALFGIYKGITAVSDYINEVKDPITETQEEKKDEDKKEDENGQDANGGQTDTGNDA